MITSCLCGAKAVTARISISWAYSLPFEVLHSMPILAHNLNRTCAGGMQDEHRRRDGKGVLYRGGGAFDVRLHLGSNTVRPLEHAAPFWRSRFIAGVI
jgi:hypothetical protein